MRTPPCEGYVGAYRFVIDYLYCLSTSSSVHRKITRATKTGLRVGVVGSPASFSVRPKLHVLTHKPVFVNPYTSAGLPSRPVKYHHTDPPQSINLLAPKLFFFNFSTPCI